MSSERTDIPLMTRAEWNRAGVTEDGLLTQLLRSSARMSKRDIVAMLALALNRSEVFRISDLGDVIGMRRRSGQLNWSNLSPLVKGLAIARMVVNLGTEENPRLAPNPSLISWDTVLLDRLRKSENSKRSSYHKGVGQDLPQGGRSGWG
jgi:predicted nucleic acid-binding protein